MSKDRGLDGSRIYGRQQDSVIKDHVLIEYVGQGRDVCIPKGVTKIGREASYSYGQTSSPGRTI